MDIFKRDGDSVYFGSYFQSNDKEKEPIKWNILKEENGKALIISDKILCYIKFDGKSNKYENSYIRKWLNDDFYNSAFTDIQKELIEITIVDNSIDVLTGHDHCRKNNSPDTFDKIFLLSVKEANTYYKNNEERQATSTKYAGTYTNDYWWLRSTNMAPSGMAWVICWNGTLLSDEEKIPDFGVRPVLWINMSKKEDEIISKIKEANELKKKTIEEEVKSKGFYIDDKSFYFGSYYQSNDKDKEPLKWNILKEEDDKTLIITDKIIDAAKFDEKSNNYEKSYIRQWLNNDFYNIAFDDIQKELIETALVDNSLKSTKARKNPYICNDTNDNIFLLSVKEVLAYYRTDKQIEAVGTEYALKKGLDVLYGNSSWWLRSPDYNAPDSAYFAGTYANDYFDDDVYDNTLGVRPALWVKLSKIEEKKKKKEKEMDETNKKAKFEEIKREVLYRYDNYLYFGSYFQSNDKDKEPLKWNILKEENGKALIITDKIIDAVEYSKNSDSNNYKDSFIRKWINNDFYNNAFNDEQKKIIETTLVDNSLKSTNNRKNEYVCENTNDKVFLLSRLEAINYCEFDKGMSGIETPYALNKKQNESLIGCWWLRSPDYYISKRAYYAKNYDIYGCEVDNADCGVRPAVWIKLYN